MNWFIVVIVLNSHKEVILQNIKDHKEVLDSIALLKILAMSSKSIKEGRVKTAKKAFSDIRKSIEKDKKSSSLSSK